MSSSLVHVNVISSSQFRSWIVLLIMTSLITDPIVPSWGVDESKFMTCDQSAFCKRYEQFANNQQLLSLSPTPQDAWIFEVLLESIQLPSKANMNIAHLDIRNTVDNSILKMALHLTQFGIFRVTIDESTPSPLYVRYRPPRNDVLSESQLEFLSTISNQLESQVDLANKRLILTTPIMSPTMNNLNQSTSVAKLIVNSIPFRIDLFINDEIVQSINHRHLLNFEKFRPRPPPQPESNIEKEEELQEVNVVEPPQKRQKLEEDTEVQFGGLDEKMEEEAEENQPENNFQKDDINFDNAEALKEELEYSAGYEHLKKNQSLETILPQRVVDAVSINDHDSWSSYFGGETDHKRRGPSAVGLDVELFGVDHVFGLPEHATPLNLPSYSEPYRSWNLDVFEYHNDSPMALYGSVPLIISLHHPKTKPVFSAFLWVNPSDSWIRLNRTSDFNQEKVVSESGTNNTSISSTFISETGLMDFVMFAGPDASSVLSQYHWATGFPTASPLFAMAKHQCRWNYNDEDDIEGVQQGFDAHEIPLDVLWLDIEHTDGKKYCTWNPLHFPTPEKMISKLARNGRKLVAIVDPHIKKEGGYHLYDTLLAENALIRIPQSTPDSGPTTFGEPFEGWCWPGTSVYPDFLDARVREIFGKFLLPPSWKASCDDLMVWNDMNEPSVFNKPELTCPREALHLDGREHREVHNLYGMSYHRTTYEALINRNPDQRPFVLSRSFFIGSHRYGAIWTGDNAAKWEYLKSTVPMLLNHALAGISFIGADVGGFFGNPDGELLVRWTQQGIWYPFYRDHAHIDTKRREPWLFGDIIMRKIRDAVQTRYRLLPEWYSKFMEYTILGHPIIRPLWWNDQDTFDDEIFRHQDEMFWFGDSILIRAINQPMEILTSTYIEESLDSAAEVLTNPVKPLVSVYLPGKNQQWFDFRTGCSIVSNSNIISVEVTDDAIPVFVKSGAILITKDRIRRSSKLQLGDPFTVVIYPHVNTDTNISAGGQLFLDDTNSFSYKKSHNFIYDRIRLSGDSKEIKLSIIPIQIDVDLSGSLVKGNGCPQSLPNINLNIEKVVIYGLQEIPKSVILNGQAITFYVDEMNSCQVSPITYKLTIKVANQVRFGTYDWSVVIQF